MQHTSELDAFKQDIRMWLEMDTVIADLRNNIKQRRLEHRILTQRILAYMNQHGIDYLNTPVGRIRFHMGYIRPPLSQQVMMQRITEYFNDDVIAAQQLRTALLAGRTRTERPVLRRT